MAGARPGTQRTCTWKAALWGNPGVAFGAFLHVPAKPPPLSIHQPHLPKSQSTYGRAREGGAGTCIRAVVDEIIPVLPEEDGIRVGELGRGPRGCQRRARRLPAASPRGQSPVPAVSRCCSLAKKTPVLWEGKPSRHLGVRQEAGCGWRAQLGLLLRG